MVFDRRFTADSPRYFRSASNADKQSDGLRPPLQDYYVLLTRSFLMVLNGSRAKVQFPGIISWWNENTERSCGSTLTRTQWTLGSPKVSTRVKFSTSDPSSR